MVSQRGFFRRRRDVSTEMSRLRDDLGKLRDDLGRLTSALMDSGRETAQEQSQRVRDRFAQPADRLQHAYVKARKRGRRLAHQLEGTVEEHPMASMLSAAVIGMLVAAVLAMLGMMPRDKGMPGDSMRP